MKIFTILKNIVNRAKAYTDAIFNQMSDFLIEEGTNGFWTYRKWNSGLAECWGTTTIAPNFNQRISTSSYLYFSSDGASVTLPNGLFTSIYTANVNGHDNVTSSWGVYCGVKPTTTNLQVNPLAWNNGGSRTITIQINVKGTWR